MYLSLHHIVLHAINQNEHLALICIASYVIVPTTHTDKQTNRHRLHIALLTDREAEYSVMPQCLKAWLGWIDLAK